MPSALSALPTSSGSWPASTNDSTLAFSVCGADQADAVDVGQSRSGVLEQCMLVGRDAFDANPFDVAQRLAETDGVGDVAGARLELVGRPLIQRAFQRDVGDHVAAALPRRRLLERVLACRRARRYRWGRRSCGRRTRRSPRRVLHVDRDVRNRLRAVDQHPRAVTVTQFDDLLAPVTVPSALETCVAATSFVFGPSRSSNSDINRLPASSTGATLQHRTGLLRKQLPRNDVGVMFQVGDDDLVAGPQVLAAPRVGHQVDGLGGAADEDDLLALATRR